MITNSRFPLPPSRAVPVGATDTHAHVYAAPYPEHNVSYAIPRAHPDTYRRMLDAAGLTHGVVVQADAYTDTALLEATLTAGAGVLAGVAVVHEGVTDEHLWRLHELGVRGVRFNIQSDRRTGKAYPGSATLADLDALAPRMADLGWHAQLWGPLEQCLDVAARHPLPFVLDHLAWPVMSEGVQGTSFQRLLTALAAGDVWVKLLIRFFPLDEVRPFHDALVAARPDRMLWGSDWPFPGLGDDAPDVGELLDTFLDWVDDDIATQILVTNPAKLYELRPC